MTTTGIVIVGGGLAAVRTVQGLRSLGYPDPITILTEESVGPYDRPPLSKDFLTGDLDECGLALLGAGAIEELGVDVRLEHRVVRVDRSAKNVVVADGTIVAYRQLVIATGARARRLPGLEPSPRVHYLRTVVDATALRDALTDVESVLVIGSGFIGLEVASSARHLDKHVHVVAADAGPMINILGGRLSAWVEQLHAASGVVIENSTFVTSVAEGPAGVTIGTSSGSEHNVDLVVVGAGINRELDWIDDAGLATDGGLLCDADGRTSDPDVFGVGDIVCRHTALGREDIQHWTAAADSARRTAHALLGKEHSHNSGDGFFWSEQHGRRLQFVGTAALGSTLELLHGDMYSNQFVAEVRTDGAVTGVFASSSPKEFLKSRLQFQKRGSAVGVATENLG